jgi:CheY-like chemotaxis protein
LIHKVIMFTSLPIEEFCSSPFDFNNEDNTVLKNIKLSPKAKNFLPLILIVEDDEDTRQMLKYLLEIWNYRIIEAVTGEEALEKAENFQPDVILMDYRLPTIDGLTTTRRLREISKLEKTIIIFVSANTDNKTRAAALAAGANDYLIKPIDFGKLEQSLSGNFNLKQPLEAEFA